jgi:fluoroacetyl-CoA thioesterase
MSPLDKVTVGMAAEKKVTVTPEMTVGHVVPGMPAVYGTPMMILHMEMASGSAIAPFLPAAYVSVGMAVNVRHLAATPVGRTVHAIARVAQIEAKSVVFEVEAGQRPQDWRRHPPARHRQYRRVRKAVRRDQTRGSDELTHTSQARPGQHEWRMTHEDRSIRENRIGDRLDVRHRARHRQGAGGVWCECRHQWAHAGQCQSIRP